jgi:hypothetical protein
MTALLLGLFRLLGGRRFAGVPTTVEESEARDLPGTEGTET